MKKILIAGTTQGSNYGDILFAYLFKERLEKKDKKNQNQILFLKSSSYAKDVLGIKELGFRDLVTLDGLVYMSGNFFGESRNESIKESIRRFVLYFFVGIVMALRKKPIAILGVGAGPLNKSFLRKAAVVIFNNAKVISVRDPESYNYMKKYGVNSDMLVTADSAQIIDTVINNNNRSGKVINDNEKLNNKYIVLVHNTTNHKDIYREKVIKALISKYGKDEDVAFVLANDNINMSEELKSLEKMFPESKTVVYNFYNPLEFTKLISEVDAVVTTKLHAGIVGATFNKSVLCFAIHPEKSKRYYNLIGYPERCESLYDISSVQVEEILENYLMKSIILPDKIRDLAMKNFELLDEFYDKYII